MLLENISSYARHSTLMAYDVFLKHAICVSHTCMYASHLSIVSDSTIWPQRSPAVPAHSGVHSPVRCCTLMVGRPLQPVGAGAATAARREMPELMLPALRPHHISSKRQWLELRKIPTPREKTVMLFVNSSCCARHSTLMAYDVFLIHACTHRI